MTNNFYEGQAVACVVNKKFPMVFTTGDKSMLGTFPTHHPILGNKYVIDEILGDYLRFDELDCNDESSPEYGFRWWHYSYFSAFEGEEYNTFGQYSEMKVILISGRNAGKKHALSTALEKVGIELIERTSEALQIAGEQIANAGAEVYARFEHEHELALSQMPKKSNDAHFERVMQDMQREIEAMKPITLPSTKAERSANRPPQNWGKYQQFFRK